MKKTENVLFIGNSITLHPPAPEIGWYGDWGMAASSKDKDYVHCIIEKLKEKNIPAEFIIRNMADYERTFWEYDLKNLKEIRDFNADIIIMRIAENVNDDDAVKKNFGEYYNELINYFNASGKAMVICTSGFWYNKNINEQIKKVAKLNNYIFVDITMLSSDEANMAKKEFAHEGVGAHPSDEGMKNIANIIFDSIVTFKSNAPIFDH
jgi:hypothetical protein